MPNQNLFLKEWRNNLINFNRKEIVRKTIVAKINSENLSL